MLLYHYFERSVGPFVSLSGLPLEQAQRIQNRLRIANKTFAAQRNEQYLARRKYLETLTRTLFQEKGGHPVRQTPHYMVVGECPWLATWFEDSGCVQIPIEEFDLATVSFTYGDMFPTFSPLVTDGLEYRGKVYTYHEILGMIEKYGLPQDRWQKPDFAQPCYVEVQVWSDDPIVHYQVT